MHTDLPKTRPELVGTFGMVSSTHWLASAVAMAVLEDGGNAFDAAAAAGFTLQVVEPHQNGPGGDLPAIFWRPGMAQPTVLCAQGPAPRRATPQAFRRLGLDTVPGSGSLPAAIPGATLGWLTLLRDHGTKPLGDVLQFALDYSKNGFPLTANVVAFIGNVEDLFRRDWPTSADLYLQGGGVPATNSVHRNPALAQTYQRLVDASSGRDRESGIDAAMTEWAEGEVAREIEAFCKLSWMDSSGSAHAGLIDRQDLASWRPTYEPTTSIQFAGHEVHKTGPWGQGPVLLQQLAMLRGAPLQPSSADSVHLMVECAKLAFADRDAWYGDRKDIPIEILLSTEYAERRRRLVSERASAELRPGSPDGRSPRVPRHEPAADPRRPGVGEPNQRLAAFDTPQPDGSARSDTVHVDIVDRSGSMISAVPSGGWLFSSPVIPELGFPLGTRLQMAWLEEGLPNTLAPGKRPRTTLSPTLVMREGEGYLACGSPGGDQQDQWTLNFLVNHLVHGLDLQDAIEAPAFHTDHFPSSFYPHERAGRRVLAEGRLGSTAIDSLRNRGHDVEVAGDWSLGRLCAVSRDPGTGLLRAGANPRGAQGYAAGR